MKASPFLPERLGQVVQFRRQPVVAQQQGHLDRRRVGVVGRLRHVEVIVRLDDLVVALLVPGQLERDVGHHLVGVHVGRGAGPALIPVDLELVVILPLHDGFGGLLDRPEHLLVHRADVGVAARRRQFHDRPRFHEPGIVADRDPRDLEVFERPRRLNTVVRRGGDRLLAQEISLHAGGPGRRRWLSGRRRLGGRRWLSGRGCRRRGP